MYKTSGYTEIELLPEDFLEKVPAFDSSLLLDVVPHWATRGVAGKNGRRGKKYPVTWQSYTYHSPHNHMRPYSAPSSPWADENNARQRAHERAIEKRRRRGETPTPFDELSCGNLKNEDYRFWIGNSYASNVNARCRWCLDHIYGETSRLDHMKRKGACGKLIRATLEWAASRRERFCMVCEASTAWKHWGVNLCYKKECIDAWMFTHAPGTMRGWRKYAKECIDSGRLDKLYEEYKNTPRFYSRGVVSTL